MALAYPGTYTFPVRSTVEESLARSAQAQAQMYGTLGQAVGKVANAYFEKKDEKDQIEALANRQDILELIYRDREAPADPKERMKDVKALYKGLGGRVGVENLLLRTKAEERAQSADARSAETLNLAKQEFGLKESAYKENLRRLNEKNEALMTIFGGGKPVTREVREPRGTVGEAAQSYLGGLLDPEAWKEASGRLGHPLSERSAELARLDPKGYVQELRKLEERPLEFPMRPPEALPEPITLDEATKLRIDDLLKTDSREGIIAMTKAGTQRDAARAYLGVAPLFLNTEGRTVEWEEIDNRFNTMSATASSHDAITRLFEDEGEEVAELLDKTSARGDWDNAYQEKFRDSLKMMVAMKEVLGRTPNLEEILETGDIGGGVPEEVIAFYESKEFDDLRKRHAAPEVAQPAPKASYLGGMMTEALGRVGEIQLPEKVTRVTTQTPAPFAAPTQEEFIRSATEAGLGAEDMPTILEIAKLKPSLARRGAQGVGSFLLNKTFPSKADAVREFRALSTRFGIPGSEAAEKQFAENARIVDPEKVKESIQKDLKAFGLDTQFEAVQSISKISKLLELARGVYNPDTEKMEGGNPAARAAAVRAIARLFDKGPLTDRDVKPFEGSTRYSERLEQALEEQFGEGGITETNFNYLSGVVEDLAEHSRNQLSERLPQITGKAAKRFNITEEWINEITMAGEMIPKPGVELQDDAAAKIKNASRGDVINDPKWGSVRVIQVMPDGKRRVVLPNGQVIEVQGDRPQRPSGDVKNPRVRQVAKKWNPAKKEFE